MSSFPLPTLAPTINAAGISAPSFEDVLQSITASYQGIFGSDIQIGPDTQDGQDLAIRATIINDVNQAIIAIYNGFLPTYAQGAGLSALVKINGISRDIATNSTAVITVTGQNGTEISNGVVQDINGNLWSLPSVVIIPGSGTIDVTATCQTIGAITASDGTINQIFNPQLGWQTATNAAPAVAGAPVESDAALRERQTESVSLPSLTPLGAILAAILNVTGVQRATIEENQTGIEDGNGVPGHTISAVVEGGDITAIAQAIESKKAPGTGTFGDTEVTVEDPEGNPITIAFQELEQVPIYVKITVTRLAGWVTTTETNITNAVVNFLNNLSIGEEVYYTWLLAAASLPNDPLGQTYVITDFRIGLAPSPTGTANLPMSYIQAAQGIAANVTYVLV